VFVTKRNRIGEKNAEVNKYCDEIIDWIESNPNATTEEFQAKMKEVQEKVQELVQKAGGMPGGMPGGDGAPPSGGDDNKNADIDEID